MIFEKKKKRRKISLLMCLFLTAGLTTTMPAIASSNFTDGSSIEHSQAVAALVNDGIINGYPDGAFRPQGTLTRAEACAILTRMKGGNASGQADFTDVSSEHWAKGYIAYCASEGVVAGYGDGKFGPEDQLTGIAWSKMVLAATGYDAVATGMVGTKWNIGVSTLASKEDIYNDIGNNFNTSASINRDNSCQIVYNALYRDIREPQTGNPVSSDVMDQLSYTFGNTREEFGYGPGKGLEFPPDCFYAIYGTHQDAFELWTKYRNWSGECFGISGTTEMFYLNNGIAPGQFRSNATNPKDLNLSDRSSSWNMTLQDYIEAIQVTQYDSSISKKLMSTNVNRIAEMCRKVESFSKGQSEPVIIAIFGKTKKGTGGWIRLKRPAAMLLMLFVVFQTVLAGTCMTVQAAQYVVVTTNFEKTLTASDGLTYRITVKCPQNSGIPKDAVLEVVELNEEESRGYLELAAESGAVPENSVAETAGSGSELRSSSENGT